MSAAVFCAAFPGAVVETNAGGEDCLLMVLGGRAPSAAWLSSLSCFSKVWAVDKGIEVCRAAGLVPDMLIGDGDSASRESWRWAEEKNVPVHRFDSEKDLTDFQLALEICAREHKNQKKNIILTGAFGGRFDHLWSVVLSFLNSPVGCVPFCIADDREAMLFLQSEEHASVTFETAPKALSVIPFSPRCARVTFTGVRWPLDCAELKYSRPYSISNRLEGGRTAKLSCGEGTLGLYWIFNEADHGGAPL